tara:strand:+ start:29 stop:442 length:414 start_codon:yes stop_codon:yes gene_type:complete
MKIEYYISLTEKEIYSFTQTGNTYIYSGIMYSNRDYSFDKWGEVWGQIEYMKALEELDRIDDEEYLDECEYNGREAKISKKYNPCRNKTIHGKVRHHGEYWGYGYNKDKPIPKFTLKEIEEKILQSITFGIKIEGVN